MATRQGFQRTVLKGSCWCRTSGLFYRSRELIRTTSSTRWTRQSEGFTVLTLSAMKEVHQHVKWRFLHEKSKKSSLFRIRVDIWCRCRDLSEDRALVLAPSTSCEQQKNWNTLSDCIQVLPSIMNGFGGRSTHVGTVPFSRTLIFRSIKL